MSRVGECLRVGCNQSFCYFFEKLHTYCVAEAYSLLPGMENYFVDTDIYNRPIEAFGIPDQLPIFSLLCNGDINNYRIYNYCDQNEKNLLIGLYKLTNELAITEDGTFHDETTYPNSFYHPRYVYDYHNKSILFIRKNLKITYEDIKKIFFGMKILHIDL